MSITIFDEFISASSPLVKIKDNTLYIDNFNESIIIENKSKKTRKITINISDSKVTLLEKTSNIDIEVNIENSTLSLQSLNFKNYKNKKIVNVLKKSHLNYEQVSLKSAKEELTVNLLADSTTANIKYLIVNADNTSEINTLVNHLALKTISEVNNYAVVTNNASASFTVIGKIAKGFSKSKCTQLSRGLILGENSEVIAKPILLIDEFDVLAHHGASIGRVNDDDLYYLMSRGLTKEDAYKLIIMGIVKPFMDSILIKDFEKKLNKQIKDMIGG